MTQCHDDYGEYNRPNPPPNTTAGPASMTVEPPHAPLGAQCHDIPEINVLIADADPGIRSRLRRLLEADGRFGAITEVSAGDEAVVRSTAPDIDLIVVDLRAVRGLGALGAIGQIRRQASHPPVVALGRSGEDWLELAARREGAVDIVEWPDQEADLRNRLVLAAAAPTPTG